MNWHVCFYSVVAGTALTCGCAKKPPASQKPDGVGKAEHAPRYSQTDDPSLEEDSIPKEWFFSDGIAHTYPIKNFEEAIARRDNEKLVALIDEWSEPGDGTTLRQSWFSRAIDAGMHDAIRELGKDTELLSGSCV